MSAVASIGAGVDLLKDNSVIIDYTSLDMDALFEDLVTYAQTEFSDRWTNFNETEWAVAWTRLLSYIGDQLFYQHNATIGETNPITAVRRKNFIVAAKPFDFVLDSASASSVDIQVTSDPAQLPILLSASSYKLSDGDNVFMPTADYLLTLATETVPFVNGDLQDNELLGTSDGQPDQEFALGSSPLIDDTLTVYVNAKVWEARTNRADAQSTDEVYFIETDEDDNTIIVFGDGVNGKVPPLTHEIRGTYKVGGGKAANADARTITTQVTVLSGIISVTNPEAASGGLNRQTLQQGKAALPGSTAANTRCVVPADYAAALFDSRLDSLGRPSGIIKASAKRSGVRTMNVWAVPGGGGTLSSTLLNEMAAFYRQVAVSSDVRLRDATYIGLRLKIGAYIKPNFQQDDVVNKLRALLVTEGIDPEFELGIFDLDNVGFGARDDDREPQITITRLQQIFARLRDFGLQKGVVELLTTIPVAKVPLTRNNSGNSTITDVTLPANISARREWALKWKGADVFDVYQRIVGRSTFITDTQLVDDRLDLDSLPDITLPLPGGTIVNPNRTQSVEFGIDVVNSQGTTVLLDATTVGTLFGVAAPGDDYYIEFLDQADVDLAGAPSLVVNSALSSGFSFTVNRGTVEHTAGDVTLFDAFPSVGDIVLRDDEIPEFVRDENGVATDLEIVVRTAE